MEWAAISAVAAIGGFGLAFATFWLTFGGRIGRAETDATNALAQAKEANDKVAIQTAAFALYREQVAREYIHREVMREVEDRLTQAIDRLGERLDRFTEAAFHRELRPGMSVVAKIDLVMLCLFPLVWSFLSIVAWEAFKSWRNRD